MSERRPERGQGLVSYGCVPLFLLIVIVGTIGAFVFEFARSGDWGRSLLVGLVAFLGLFVGIPLVLWLFVGIYLHLPRRH